MSKAEKHELIDAAKEGEAGRVLAYLKKDLLKPESDKCKKALLVASELNRVECVKILLEFGVDAKATEGGTSALHRVAEAGFDACAKLLLAHKADFENKNLEGMNSMRLAIMHKPPNLGIVKELLRASAKLSANDNAPGVAALVKEVQMEKLGDELRAQATIQVNQADLQAADLEVWKAQRAHMQLLMMKEEQKAGVQLMALEKRVDEENAQAREIQKSEESLAEDLKDKRVALQSVTQELQQVLKELEDVTVAEAKMRVEADRVGGELSEERKQVRAALREKDECDKARKMSEEAKEEALEHKARLQAELVVAREKNAEVQSELLSAQHELKGWMRDKEQAAKLTSQAQRILATN